MTTSAGQAALTLSETTPLGSQTPVVLDVSGE